MNSDISGTLINAKDVNGDTAAHDAADNGYALYSLGPIRCGSEANSTTNRYTVYSTVTVPLHCIIYHRQTEALDVLLESGADLYAVNNVSKNLSTTMHGFIRIRKPAIY